METTHENSRFRSQLLEKTSVLKSSKVRYLKPQFRSQLLEKTIVLNPALLARLKCINKLTKAKCKLSVISFTSLLASCQPSYASLLKIQEVDYLVTEPKIQPSDVGKSHLTNNSKSEDSSQLNKINQLSFFDSFNCVAKVAVTGNNQILSKSTSVSKMATVNKPSKP